MNGDLDPFPGILILFFLLFADFICSAFAKAASGLSEAELRGEEDGDEEEKDKDKDKADKELTERDLRIREELALITESPEDMIRASVFWLALCAAVIPPVIGKVSGISIWGAILIAVVLVFIFGWAFPGYVGKVHGICFIRRVFSVWRLLCRISIPFTFVFDKAAVFLARIFGSDPAKIREEVTEDEIISMVNEGHQQGNVDEDEAEMIRNIFELDEKQAQDIMTVRGKIIALPGQMTLDHAIKTMVGSPNSRFPVYDDSIDNIIGALYLKDAMSFHLKEQFNTESIRRIPGLLREVKFVPETRRIDELFTDMQKSQVQIAIVSDEYGDTAGLVTMEDILEEIVGNIFDEYDRVEKVAVPVGPGKWRLSGMAPLSDVAKALGIEDREDYETLNGYLTAALDHVPEADDVGKVIDDKEDGIRFTVKSVYSNTVQWALAEKYQPDS